MISIIKYIAANQVPQEKAKAARENSDINPARKSIMKKALAALLSVAVLMIGAMVAQAQDSGQVTIKDQAEFNAYNSIEGTTDPVAKAANIEAFLVAYPNSVVKTVLLEQLMGAYVQTQNADKAVDAAARVLKDNPNNIRALSMKVYIEKTKADQTQDAAAKQSLLDDAAVSAAAGLAWKRPLTMSEADYKNVIASVTPIFYSTIAEDVEGKKDYATAEKNYMQELTSVPAAQTIVPGQLLQDTFNMALDYYNQQPQDYLSCAYYAVRSAHYAPEPYKTSFNKTAKYCFHKYIGPSPADGQTLEALESIASNSLTEPADLKAQFKQFDPKDMAHNVIATTADLTTLAFSDREFILQNATQEDADKLWAVMNGVTVAFSGTVVSVSADGTQVLLAVTDEAIGSKNADFAVTMKEPIAVDAIPAVGATIKINGTFTSYTKSPVVITLTDGSIPVEKKAPVHKAPVHHTAAH